jgi:uncharacterized short protein YbdD (DUF466 family)
LVFEYINGDFAYKNYLKNFNKNHIKNLPSKNQKPLSKKKFLNEKNIKKWNGVNRCC